MLHTYEEAVSWINNLIPFGIKPGLKRMEALAEAFEHPERRLKVIHVAGTNGKGSTCRMIADVLEQCGYDVGIFTSPYIVRFTDRIRYNGEPIPDDELIRLANEVKPHVERIASTELGSPTMFEVTTMISILYFSKVAYPDYVVMETGLGGRLDSTNILHPVVSVITNVGYDHTDILGETIQQIASEKAGIIKAGVPVVSTAEDEAARKVIADKAAQLKSTCYLLDREFIIQPVKSELNEQIFDFEGPFRKIPQVKLTMNGVHQLKNAAAALMTLEVLRQYYALIVEEEDLYQAMRNVSWPGRMEMIQEHPRLLVDGAHNPEGSQALSHTIHTLYRYEKLHFMMGMLETKNHKAYLEHILPIVDTLILTEPDFRKKMSAASLEELVRQHPASSQIRIVVEPDWEKALDLLQSMTSEQDLAVVSGTLYLISDVRSRVLHHSHSEKGW
ncbi:bifunctional folylpolyglutamate synthase/dihydrofolate synthase [Marinicrinis lubricantis]|uniref:tetrahydrofolate synthase n=1 Tax=Marinicrinis lubricantis TaxID=2086470 RepID=A0ABW1IUJ3_9BACL